MMRRAAITFALLSAGCAGVPMRTTDGQPEPARTRAALALVRVDNRTQHALSILYALSTRPGATVTIGRVDSVSVAEMAPVPAGEPLVLTARTTRGHTLTLEPRTFALDSTWTWVIAADARFIPPGTEPR